MLNSFRSLFQLQNKLDQVFSWECSYDEEYLGKFDKGEMLKYSLLLAVLPRNRLDPTYFVSLETRIVSVMSVRNCESKNRKFFVANFGNC